MSIKRLRAEAALMARPAVGSVLRRATRRGTSYYLRVTWRDPATGETDAARAARRRVGGLGRETRPGRARADRKLIARDEWLPRRRRTPTSGGLHPGVATRWLPRASRSPRRHYDRRKRRMGSDKSRQDLRWRLAHAIKHLGEKPVDEISAGDIDDMVDAMLRERDAITEAAAQGAALVEDYRRRAHRARPPASPSRPIEQLDQQDRPGRAPSPRRQRSPPRHRPQRR